MKGVPPRTFSVPGLLHRNLTGIIKAVFSSPLARHFHFSPFKLFHEVSSDVEERIFSEVYNSDVFIEENDKVQGAPLPPDEPDCKREKVVAALMFWSDSTHLANFGTAKLWPIYLLFGNISKYIRGSQTQEPASTLRTYLPSLTHFMTLHPLSVTNGALKRRGILTHCRRELMHGVWRILLDEDFIHAYKYGMVVKCALDGIERRVYPRFFTYSADYPEK